MFPKKLALKNCTYRADENNKLKKVNPLNTKTDAKENFF